MLHLMLLNVIINFKCVTMMVFIVFVNETAAFYIIVMSFE